MQPIATKNKHCIHVHVSCIPNVKRYHKVPVLDITCIEVRRTLSWTSLRQHNRFFSYGFLSVPQYYWKCSASSASTHDGRFIILNLSHMPAVITDILFWMPQRESSLSTPINFLPDHAELSLGMQRLWSSAGKMVPYSWKIASKIGSKIFASQWHLDIKRYQAQFYPPPGIGNVISSAMIDIVSVRVGAVWHTQGGT